MNILAAIETLEERLAATGPRGGKIIGKTRSGKPIYAPKGETAMKSSRERGDHHEKHDEQHKDYTLEDHIDALAFHKHNKPHYNVDMKSNHAHDAAEHYHDRKIGEMTNDYKFTPEHKEMAQKSNEHYRPKGDKVLHKGFL